MVIRLEGVFRATTGIVLVAVVLSLVAGSALASSAGSPVVAQQANNTTVQQENPDNVNENGDQEALQSWLQGKMSGLLGESAVKLSQGEYEAARQVLGDQYAEYYGKYVDVAGETQGETADALNETRQTQSRYASLLEQYEKTYERYQEAKANGNQSGARRLARKLLSLSNQINSAGGNLTRSYNRVGNTTNTNVSQSVHQVQNITENVTTRGRAVVRAEFESTTLSVTGTRSGSYRDPLQVTGQLRARNHSLPETVTLAVGDHTERVSLTQNGSFTLTYRPVGVRVGEQNLTVRYLPRDTALFLGSNTTTRAEITQTVPTLTVESARTEASYKTVVPVRGRVTVDGGGVPGVPVRLTIDGMSFGVVRTNESGVYATTITIPAGVSVNASAIAATIAYSDRAIASASARTSVSIVETPTMLSVETDVHDGQVVVSGRLTANGTAVDGMSVAIVENGTAVATATTQNGRFSTTIPHEGTESMRVRVVFSGAGTNLADASAVASVQFPTREAGGTPVELIGLVGVLAVAVLGGVGVWYRQQADTVDSAEAADGVADAVVETSDPAAASRSGVEGLRGLDETDGVVVAYGRVRRALTPFLSVDEPGRTHWEFAHTVHSELDGEVVEAVEVVTRAYERVTYAETALDEGERAAVDAAVSEVVAWIEQETFDGEPRSDVSNE